MVELIVVVAILGVLAAILIPTLLGITIRATEMCIRDRYYSACGKFGH